MGLNKQLPILFTSVVVLLVRGVFKPSRILEKCQLYFSCRPIALLCHDDNGDAVKFRKRAQPLDKDPFRCASGLLLLALTPCNDRWQQSREPGNSRHTVRFRPGFLDCRFATSVSALSRRPF